MSVPLSAGSNETVNTDFPPQRSPSTPHRASSVSYLRTNTGDTVCVAQDYLNYLTHARKLATC